MIQILFNEEKLINISDFTWLCFINESCYKFLMEKIIDLCYFLPIS